MPKSRERLAEVLLYRVISYLEDAALAEPGGALHVPAIQGAGRVDNPEHYRVLYLADDPAGAVGESLGRFHTWGPVVLHGPPALTGSRKALATYEGEPALLDLDEPTELVARDLPPSRVVTQDWQTTQRWGLAVWSEQRWQGVRWWSRWHADWGSVGLWDQDGLQVVDVQPLHAAHPALVEAAAILNRPWRASR